MMSTVVVIPRRDYGRSLRKSDTDDTPRLPPTVSIVGLGCSSFSTFFWTPQEVAEAIYDVSESTTTTRRNNDNSMFTAESLSRDHPKVQEWVDTIQYAITQCRINVLDTAPWYGHGTSEIVIGWALEELLDLVPSTKEKKNTTPISRTDIVINTKVGRYESDPVYQFDFTYDMTIRSVQRSIDRMKCGYIDVLQLHDPEFSPTLDVLMNETIPAMVQCREKGLCKALGMTGYPLEVQYQLLQRTYQQYGKDGIDVWDQALTYGHFNLHDSSLVDRPISTTRGISDDDDDGDKGRRYSSFANYCQRHNIGLLAAAPLSMGLLTGRELPTWHPAKDAALANACRTVHNICQQHGVDIATLALLYALSHPQIPCTILGMKDVTEVERAATVARRFDNIDWNGSTKQSESMSQKQYEILKQVLTEPEMTAYRLISDRQSGPFAAVWSDEVVDGRGADGATMTTTVPAYQWDGVQLVYDFWKAVAGAEYEEWQQRTL